MVKLLKPLVFAWAGLAPAVIVLLVALFFAARADAQNVIDFQADITQADRSATPTFTWSTTPDAQDCVAAGGWSGSKGPSGSETLGPLTSSATFSLTCTWPGDTQAALSWTNPSQNCDGSPFTDHGETIIRYALGTDPVIGDPADPCGQPGDPVFTPADLTFDCDVGGIRCVTGLTPADTQAQVADLLQVGDWTFYAHVCNTRGICSGPSNGAVKAIAGDQSSSDSVGITINPIPAAPPAFNAN